MGAGAITAVALSPLEALGSEWDLVIVGAGTAGLPAAIAAARRNLNVLVVEKASQMGGTLWISGGQMSAAGTFAQSELGIEDRPEDHLSDILRISEGTADRELASLAVAHAADTVDWLMTNGLKLNDSSPTVGTGHEQYGKPRVYAPENRGLSTLNILRALVNEAKPSILYEAEAVELIISRNTVAGVVVRMRDGLQRDILARNVLIASGGHNGNPRMFRDLHDVPLYRQPAVSANVGTGIELALQAGGYCRGGHNYLCDFGSIPASFEWPSPEFGRSSHHPHRRPPWEIYVNVDGERFLREDEPSVHQREIGLLKQPMQRYWTIFDRKVLEESPPLVRSAPPSLMMWSNRELTRLFGKRPAFERGESLEELARRIGVPAATLIETVRRYNEGQSSGEDWLGRQHMPVALKNPPFYAICHQGSTLLSFSGVAVNQKLQLIRKSGEAIRNVYAAGEVLGFGNVSGRAYCGGMGVTPALTFGRMLGQRLAAS